MRSSRAPLLISLLVLLFFYLPIGMLIVQSFNDARFGGSWRGLSLRWYRELLERRDIHEATWNTLRIAIASTVISVVLGSFAAWSLHRYTGRLQRMHRSLVYAPLV